MNFTLSGARAHANQHDGLPNAFLNELADWAKIAPDDVFAQNAVHDIYSRVMGELGPFTDLLQRKAVMCEVLNRLAQFESDGDWHEGVDTSRLGDSTPENEEAGAWQESYDSRKLDPSLRTFLLQKGIMDGVTFQRRMKRDHDLSEEEVKAGKTATHYIAMEYTARLLRIDTTNPQRLANGPLYKGDERYFIRRSLRGPENTIYPWLKRQAVEEFKQAISA